jgi:hypothetical protein
MATPARIRPLPSPPSLPAMTFAGVTPAYAAQLIAYTQAAQAEAASSRRVVQLAPLRGVPGAAHRPGPGAADGPAAHGRDATKDETQESRAAGPVSDLGGLSRGPGRLAPLEEIRQPRVVVVQQQLL